LFAIDVPAKAGSACNPKACSNYRVKLLLVASWLHQLGERWPQKIGQRYKWISGLINAMLMATISGGNHAQKTTPESLTAI
jgi:hypothetical protein